MNSFKVCILEADRAFYEGDCESLVIPTTDGQYGVQAGHCNVIAAIVPGTLIYRTPGGEDIFAAVSHGILKVEDNDVLVLADSIELPEEIDVNRAMRAEAEAKEAILQKKTMEEYVLAQAQISRALNRLKVKSRYK